jgi:sarcosine oxidase subunit gamma
MAEPAATRSCAATVGFPGMRASPPAARFILRGAAPVIRAAGAAVGIEIEATPCRAFRGQGRAALWLGPDEYLLLAPEEDAQALYSALQSTLHAEAHALVDVSHRQIALALQGPHASELLSSGCPLDLDLGAFPPTMCTRTVFAKTEILLWRIAPEEFHIEVWRSFAAYLAQLLAQAARENGAAPHVAPGSSGSAARK